jgi:putative cell wall-binding protein
MEYILGAIITLGTVAFVSNRLNKSKAMKVSVNVRYSQSRAFELMKPLNIFSQMLEMAQNPMITQTTKHNDSMHVKVVIADNEAYWISNNKFYVADVRDKMVVQESTREVDTMAMDDVELKKISEIVEILRKEDKNDRGSSGNKKL